MEAGRGPADDRKNMLTLLLALIGLPAGFVLDAIIGRLATAPYEDEEGEETAEPVGLAAPSLHGEAGSLLIEQEATHTWRRRLLTVAATTGLFAIAAARYEGGGALAVVCVYLCALLICASTDLLSYRVPNVITYPAILGAIVAGAFMPGSNFLDAVFGGLLAGGVLLLPALLTGGVGMGMGDVKLAAFVGLAVGFQLIPVALLAMAITGGAVAAFLLVSGLRKRGEPIPYAPFIAGGAIATLLWQGAVFSSLT
jgi:prepilin signal peptidase PulO-like enzyme (type II secretory pathway)